MRAVTEAELNNIIVNASSIISKANGSGLLILAMAIAKYSKSTKPSQIRVRVSPLIIPGIKIISGSRYKK